MKKSTLLVFVALTILSMVTFAQDVETPDGFRANSATYSPLMDMLASSRDVQVTDAQLEALETLQLEAIWDALGEHKANYVLGLRTTQPGERVVGRALTMRFLPPRPDIREALDALAEEGDWDRRFYGRAADQGKPGDVVVVELGGASGDQMFGDVGALGMKLSGIRGAIVDGGSRDLAELGDSALRIFLYSRGTSISIPLSGSARSGTCPCGSAM